MFLGNQSLSDRPTVHVPQTMNQLANSTFYTSGSKDALFNFSGSSGTSTAPVRAPFQIGRFSREKRKSESTDNVSGFTDDVPPRKLYISEAAMSNHFARMNLTHRWDSCDAQSSGTTFVQELEMNANPTRTGGEQVDSVEESDSEANADEAPTFQMSDDLKEHLRNYPPDRPVENIIREILNPKPSLAIIPFDPNLVPAKFRQEEQTEAKDSASPSNAVTAENLTAGMDVEPITVTPVVAATKTASNLVPVTSTNRSPSVDAAMHFWMPPPTANFPSASFPPGQRNVFSYPNSNPNDRRFLYPHPPCLTQQPRMQGPFFPPL